MYDLEFQTETYKEQKNPLHSSYLVREGRDVTIVATSIMVLGSSTRSRAFAKGGGDFM